MRSALLTGFTYVGRGFLIGAAANLAFFALLLLGDYIAEGIKWGHF